MSYNKALRWVRQLLSSSSLGAAAMPLQTTRSYTLHSLKTTVLSWARQAHLPEDLRSDQGHHRQHAGKSSVRLYSRDDV